MAKTGRDTRVCPHPVGFPGGAAGEEPARSAGDPGSTPGSGRSPGGGKGYPLQYSGLENSMGCMVRGVAKSRTRLSTSHFSTPLSPEHSQPRHRGCPADVTSRGHGPPAGGQLVLTPRSQLPKAGAGPAQGQGSHSPPSSCTSSAHTFSFL